MSMKPTFVNIFTHTGGLIEIRPAKNLLDALAVQVSRRLTGPEIAFIGMKIPSKDKAAYGVVRIKGVDWARTGLQIYQKELIEDKLGHLPPFFHEKDGVLTSTLYLFENPEEEGNYKQHGTLALQKVVCFEVHTSSQYREVIDMLSTLRRKNDLIKTPFGDIRHLGSTNYRVLATTNPSGLKYITGV